MLQLFLLGAQVVEIAGDVFGQRVEGQQEVQLFAALLAGMVQVGLEALVADDDIVVGGELTDAHDEMGGIGKVDGKNAEKDADEKGKGKILS